VGGSQHRILFARDAPRRPRPRQDSRHSDLGHARLRQPGRRFPPHGGSRSLRNSRDRRAQQRYLCPPSGNHRGGREAPLGMDGTQSKQLPSPQRSAGRRGVPDQSARRSTRSRARAAGVPLAGLAPVCRKPGTHSITWQRPVANMLRIGGPTTISPTR